MIIYRCGDLRSAPGVVWRPSPSESRSGLSPAPSERKIPAEREYYLVQKEDGEKKQSGWSELVKSLLNSTDVKVVTVLMS